MATIDYKEKYEQAMERARQFIEKPYLEDSAGIVRYIFPELTESEDERIRKELIEFVKSRGGFKQEYIAWLEKQGEQNNAWSEEDEQMLNHVIIDIESLKEQVYCRTLCDEEIDWLKSLRPQSQWKLSEEQMDALESAVSSLQSTALESLYQDLTKNK